MQPTVDDFLHKTEMCKFYPKGKCTRGEECNFAHDPSELKVKPDLLKTRLCRSFIKSGFCRSAADCKFAHGLHELNAMPFELNTLEALLWKLQEEKPTFDLLEGSPTSQSLAPSVQALFNAKLREEQEEALLKVLSSKSEETQLFESTFYSVEKHTEQKPQAEEPCRKRITNKPLKRPESSTKSRCDVSSTVVLKLVAVHEDEVPEIETNLELNVQKTLIGF